MFSACRNGRYPPSFLFLLLLIPLLLSPLLFMPFPFYLLLSSNLNWQDSFDSLTQLPLIFRSFEDWIRPQWVISVDDYGAKGNGLNDDTKNLLHLGTGIYTASICQQIDYDLDSRDLWPKIPYPYTDVHLDDEISTQQAFLDAWEAACSCYSRSVLKIPAGRTYLVKPADFGGPCQSKVTLRISGNIVAPKDPKIWNELNPTKWLYFHGVDHLSVGGGGTINGMGQKWWERSCKIHKTNPCHHAPTALTFHRCNNLEVSKLTLLNSQQMHMAVTLCYRVKVSHLQVIAPFNSPNTDAIHISASKQVEVQDTKIETGDDCISIVSNTSAVKIKNITCGPGHGISIGSLGKYNSCSEVHDILVDGAFISHTENGVRIKTWQGGSGFARDITFQNIAMVNVSNPIIIDQYYCDSPSPCPNQTQAVRVERVSYKHIRGTSATEEAITLACSDHYPCNKILLRDIMLLHPGGNTSSYCWKAWGTSSGLAYPNPCFP